MLTVYIIILISRIPFFQQAGGHMWSKEQEGAEKIFFFFFNWILGPQDEMCQETEA